MDHDRYLEIEAERFTGEYYDLGDEEEENNE